MEIQEELVRQFEIEIYQYLQRSCGLYPKYLIVSSIDFSQLEIIRNSCDGEVTFMGVQILESPGLKKNKFIFSEEKWGQ